MKPGVIVWLTGRPSSGKSTLARNVASTLQSRGTPCCVLDGDEVRAALVPKPGYDEKSRDEFYATLTSLAVLLSRQGFVVLVPATAHSLAIRARARAAADTFVEVYVAASEEICKARDAKGLYAKSSAGNVANLPGADLRYEEPPDPDVRATGGQDTSAVEQICSRIAMIEPQR